MNPQQTTQTSKFLSLVLRHKPEEIGLALDPSGWVGVSDLLEALARHGRALAETDLEFVVATNEKKRFEFSEDGLRIRASQGHSVEVDLGYAPADPPDILYHGTIDRFLESIRQTGLVKGSRHHVHLSKDSATATNVGQRRGKPVILTIDAAAMKKAGLTFFVSTNGVWLTEHVPTQFIQFPM